MTRYLLDTNIVRDATKPSPSPALATWLSERDDLDLFIAAFTVAEIKRGIVEAPAGRKRRELEVWFDGDEGPAALFAGRILAFDVKAALEWARLMSEGKRSGRSRDGFDMIIAATGTANNCVVVTDNERDFRGLATLNPLRG